MLRLVTARVRLSVVDGPLKGRALDFDAHDAILVGRAPDCALRLPDSDKTASDRHCIIEVNPPAVRVRDVGSRNGTRVNGVRHGGRAQPHTGVDLQDGDRVQVGRTVVRVEIAGAAPARCSRCGSPEPRPGGLCARCRTSSGFDPLDVIVDEILRRAHARDGDVPKGIRGYAVEGLVGRGGMGSVYRARREKDGRTVAVKVMLSHIAVIPKARKLFDREIDVLLGLRHANIVELIEHGSAGAAFYFVMEFCEGGSLLALARPHPHGVPMDVALPVMRGTLDGLDGAHRQGFVHRDMKPDNVLLTGGVAKVSDFGFAKSFEQAGFSGMTSTSDGHGGTTAFIAREQVTNYKFVKPSADVWSTGATFYWMLTGHLPREMPRDGDPLQTILETRATPIARHKPDLPPALAAVIDRALAFEAADRFADAGEFRAALDRAVR